MTITLDLATRATPSKPTLGLSGVSFAMRAVARILDMVVMNLTWALSTFLFGVFIFFLDSHPDWMFERLSVFRWHGLIIGLLSGISYHVIMETWCGSTAGKMVLGLGVITERGSRISVGAAFKRSVAFFVDGLFFGIPAYAAMDPPLQQRIGDSWAGTVVVKRSSAPVGGLPSGVWFTPAFFLALTVTSVFCWASLGLKLL